MSEVMIPESKLDPVESLTECLGEAVKLGGTHGTSMNILWHGRNWGPMEGKHLHNHGKSAVLMRKLQVMELEVEVWEAEGKASCLASTIPWYAQLACGRRESGAGVFHIMIPCTSRKLVGLMGLDGLFSSGPSSLEEDFDSQVEWWLGHRLLGGKNDPTVGHVGIAIWKTSPQSSP